MNDKTPSWKQKIDLAFDKLIKFYIQFLDQPGLPANSGWMVVEPDALKIWKDRDMSGWIKRYGKEMTNEKNYHNFTTAKAQSV